MQDRHTINMYLIFLDRISSTRLNRPKSMMFGDKETYRLYVPCNLYETLY